MAGPIFLALVAIFFVLTFVAWRRYLWAAEKVPQAESDTCPYTLTDTFDDRQFTNVPHQDGAQWLTDIFGRSVKRFSNHTALLIPQTGETLTFAELDRQADAVAAALSPFVTGPDQVVAVAMPQDNPQIVAAHLGILKAGGTVLFLDTTLPDSLLTHVLDDAQPVVVLTRGQGSFRGLQTLDVLTLPAKSLGRAPPAWLDDPNQRIATIFYTSGTTGLPKGVECPHAGYVNLALSYADYFDLVPGMDATSLTSSLGYDGSISEMYSAWVSGCAVAMLTKEQIQSGPDLVPILRDAEITVLFCPPVLLTTLTSTPELDLPYPICRYVVPAGEAFPGNLVEPWTRGRRQIINTYGPTEACTDTSRQSLRPGEPVTIGSPLANVKYVILEVDQLRPLFHGEVGELCIGGVHVARGYRNLPGLTAEKFIDHPQFGRLYRTGDICRIDIRTRQVHFLGRVDSQLKVRGHRVEVQAVEDRLQAQFTDIEAAVLDYQNNELVAFVVAPSISEEAISGVVAAPTHWSTQVRAALARQLPEPSVPTRIFLVENFVLNPLSGKIDRKHLPDLTRLMVESEQQSKDIGGTAAASCNDAGVEPEHEEVLAICRDVFETSLGWDDVFADHGGHSIVIAHLAQRLQAAGWSVSVRELLGGCNTARNIANTPREVRKAPGAAALAEPPHRNRTDRDETKAKILSTGYFTTLQVLFLLVLYAPFAIGFLAVVAFGELGEILVTAHLWQFFVVGFLAYLAALALPFASLFWVLIIKFFLGGHIYVSSVTPGVYPKWSRMHLRLWCIGRLEALVIRPLGTMFRSAPLMTFVLRQLGATAGSNIHCAHDAEFTGPLDLLSIGDDVTIQTGAYISMSRWVGQDLHVGPVHLESGCKIGMRAAVTNDVVVGSCAWITPFTPVLDNVGPNQMWEGAPSRCTGHCTRLDRITYSCRQVAPGWVVESLNILMQIALEFCLLIAPTAMVTWFAATFVSVKYSEVPGAYFEATPLHTVAWQMSLLALITTWVSLVLISILGCLFVRATAASPGLCHTRSLQGALLLYRIRKLNQIQRLWTWTIVGQYLRAIAGLRFTRLGASECDVMFNLVPELANADAQVFWSHGCFTNMLDHDASHLTLRRLDMPANFFSSNNSVAEFGQFPTNFLLGVSTPGNEIRFRRQMRSHLGESITVAGNPPIRFASADFEAENDGRMRPNFRLFLARVFLNDLLSVGMLRVAPVPVYVVAYTTLLRLGGHPLASAMMALVLTELILVLSCIAIKMVLVGNKWGSAHSAPFWSLRHLTYFFVQDCFFSWCRVPLGVFAGTLLSNTILRCMGCRIGSRTILAAPLQAFDWNAVNFGADCMIAGVLQLHSFESMILKIKQTDIQDGTAINIGSTIMGGVMIEPGTTVHPLSLVLKEMRLPKGIYWGSPAEPISIGDSRHSRLTPADDTRP